MQDKWPSCAYKLLPCRKPRWNSRCAIWPVSGRWSRIAATGRSGALNIEGKAYYLKFYRRSGLRDAWRRLFRGSPAAREFQRLQWLQKAGITCPTGRRLPDGI